MATIFEGSNFYQRGQILPIAGVPYPPTAGLPRYYGYNIAQYCTIGAGLGFVIINQSINMQEMVEASSANLGLVGFSQQCSAQQCFQSRSNGRVGNCFAKSSALLTQPSQPRRSPSYFLAGQAFGGWAVNSEALRARVCYILTENNF